MGEQGRERSSWRLWLSPSASDSDPFLYFLRENALLNELRSCGTRGGQSGYGGAEPIRTRRDVTNQDTARRNQSGHGASQPIATLKLA